MNNLQICVTTAGARRVRLRNGRPADAATLAAWTAGWVTDPAWGGMLRLFGKDLSPDDWGRMLTRARDVADRAILLAEDASGLLGLAVLVCRPTLAQAHLADVLIAVPAGHRRQGVGGALWVGLRSVAEKLPQVCGLCCSAPDHGPGTDRFLRQRGWRAIGRLPGGNRLQPALFIDDIIYHHPLEG